VDTGLTNDEITPAATADSDTLIKIYSEALELGFSVNEDELRRASEGQLAVSPSKATMPSVEEVDGQLSAELRKEEKDDALLQEPAVVKRGSSDPTADKSLVFSKPPTPVGRGASVGNPVGTADRSKTFTMLTGSGTDLAMSTLMTLGVVENAILSVLSLVPTTFDYDFVNFVWENRQKFYGKQIQLDDCLYDERAACQIRKRSAQLLTPLAGTRAARKCSPSS
jgi:hypothetical protein